MKVPRLEPIAPGVWLLRGGLLRTMKAYLIEDGGQVVVFDTGKKGTEAARASVRRLAALRPRIVGVGHLGPMTGPDVVAGLEAAAR